MTFDAYTRVLVCRRCCYTDPSVVQPLVGVIRSSAVYNQVLSADAVSKRYESSTVTPTAEPSVSPSNNPSASPSNNPSTNPSSTPTSHPSVTPSRTPSTSPTNNPTTSPSIPTANPTSMTNDPTASPTVYHSESTNYYYHNTPMTWTDAEAYCQSTYATHLATIWDDNAANELLNFPSDAWFFIGLHDRNTEGTWEYADGSN
eukprot:614019_1